MRILIYRTFPDVINTGGYNVQEIGLAKALVRLGHTCDIIFYNGRGKDRIETCSFLHDGIEKSYRIYWLHGFNILKNGFMPSAKKLFERYDVIQVHEYEQLSSWQAYCTQIRPTVIYHGLYHSSYTKGYNLKCFVFDRLFFNRKRSSGIYKNTVSLTKSEPAADFMRSKGFVKVRSVGVGLDDEKFRADKTQPPREAGYYSDSEVSDYSEKERDRIRLLYVGKIEDRRNSLFLLDLFEELIKRQLPVELRIIGSGEGSYYTDFKKKARPFIGRGNLVYQKSASQKEMSKEYRDADIFLFPSRYEIFGMVLLEAMYFGLPVVSSDNGGSSVVMKDDGAPEEQNGVILRDFAVMHWADATEKLIKDKGLRGRLSKNAEKTVKENFLWDSLAPRFAEAYEEAMSDRKKTDDGVTGRND